MAITRWSSFSANIYTLFMSSHCWYCSTPSNFLQRNVHIWNKRKRSRSVTQGELQWWSINYGFLETAIFLRLAAFNDHDNVMKVTNRHATKADEHSRFRHRLIANDHLIANRFLLEYKERGSVSAHGRRRIKMRRVNERAAADFEWFRSRSFGNFRRLRRPHYQRRLWWRDTAFAPAAPTLPSVHGELARTR